MPDPAAVARAKIANLRGQIAELERFLAMYEELSAAGAQQPEARPPINDAPISPDGEGNEAPQMAVDNSVESDESRGGGTRRRPPGAPKPADIADLMARIIRERGAPMTRGEIVVALEARDVIIPYEDKSRYVGTIAWRHKGLFENIEGAGYWLRGEARPKLGVDLPPLTRPETKDGIPEWG